MTAPARLPARRVAAPDAEDLRAALAAVRSALPPTPLVESPSLRALLKLESLQPVGAFKVRGAIAALTVLPADTPIVTASAGNHALGVAWAAARLGRPATVVVPENASQAKLVALGCFPVEVVCHGDSYDEAERHARERAAEHGAHYLSSYNDRHVIAGQATLGAELDQLDGPITIVCPVGGGGLLGGLCRWAADRPEVTLIGVEAEASRAMSAAVRAGRVVQVPVSATLADGVAGNIEPGSVTVDLVASRVDEIVAVPEEGIADAIRHLVYEQGVVAEGSGALAAAALLADLVPRRGTCVAIVTGRNIARDTLASLLAHPR